MVSMRRASALQVEQVLQHKSWYTDSAAAHVSTCDSVGLCYSTVSPGQRHCEHVLLSTLAVVKQMPCGFSSAEPQCLRAWQTAALAAPIHACSLSVQADCLRLLLGVDEVTSALDFHGSVAAAFSSHLSWSPMAKRLLFFRMGTYTM